MCQAKIVVDWANPVDNIKSLSLTYYNLNVKKNDNVYKFGVTEK